MWCSAIIRNSKEPFKCSSTWKAPNILKYTVAPDYSYVESYYFVKLQDLVPLIENAANGKWLIFVSSERKGEQLETLLNSQKAEPCAVFISAKRLRKNKEYREVYDKLSKESCFDTRVLIATKVIDNGIDIKDQTVHNIVISSCDKTEFIQQLGRKRIVRGETIRLYVMHHKNQSINEIRMRAYQKLWNAAMFCKIQDIGGVARHSNPRRDDLAYTQEVALRGNNYLPQVMQCFREIEEILYLPKDKYGSNAAQNRDVLFQEFRINRLSLLYWANVFCSLHVVLEEYSRNENADPNLFLKEQLKWIGKTYDETAWVDYEKKQQTKEKRIVQLKQLLQKYENAGYELNKDEQHEFAEQCLCVLLDEAIFPAALEKSRYAIMKRTKNRVGIKLLNKSFSELDIPYIIRSKQVSRDGTHFTIWKVEKDIQDGNPLCN